MLVLMIFFVWYKFYNFILTSILQVLFLKYKNF